jgi:universal stress protein E
MHTFRNILVGIDIDSSGEPSPSSREALKQACRVARKHNAALTAVHVINMPPDTHNVLKLKPQQASAEADRTLENLFADVGDLASGLKVRSLVLFGAHWQELLKQVISERNDLVVLGTRARSAIGRTLFGSTGNRLLRYCPCPVWVVRQGEGEDYRDILVAHDMTDVGIEALTIGAMMAALYKARLHVLHVIEHAEQQRFLGSIPEATLRQREQDIHSRLEDQSQSLVTGAAVDVTVCSGSPQSEILNYLRNNQNDLLCMGTVARSGLSGIVTGNTAECVLPWIDCALIAVKPAEFQPSGLS